MKNKFWNNMRAISALALAATINPKTEASPGRPEPDAALLAAVEVQANSLVEGIAFGDFETWSPGIYPDFAWVRETTEIGSNGLFQIDYAIFDLHGHRHDRHPVPTDELSVLLFRPLSRPGGAVHGPLSAAPLPDVRARKTDLRPDRLSPSGLAVGLIEDALVSALFYAANAHYYSFFSDSQSLSVVSHLPDSFPGSESFGGVSVRRVSFYLRSGRHGRHELVMEHAPLLVNLRPGQVEPFRVTLAEDVSVFHIRYWDQQRFEWMEQWPLTNSLPRMVQVTLGLGHPRGPDRLPHNLVSRIVALPSTAVQSDIQGMGIGNFPPVIPPTNQPPFLVVSPPAASPASTAQANGLLAARGPKNPRPAPKQPKRKAPSRNVELEWLGRSGVELARYVLANEGTGTGGQPIDSKLSKWAGGPGDTNNGLLAGLDLNQYSIGAGTVSVKIEDQESKFNLNVADTPILRQALAVIGVEAAQTSGIVDSILDWRDRDDRPNLNGAESAEYLALWPPYFAKNGPLDDLSELLFVRGVTREMYFGSPASGPAPAYAVGLADLFTPLSGGLINVNTASRAVLQIIPEIDENVADAIVAARAGPDGVEGTEDDTPFRSTHELAARVPGLPPTVQALARYFTVRSLVFEVRVIARINDESRMFVALLRRNGPRDVQLMNFHWE